MSQIDSDNTQRFEGVASQSVTSGTVGTLGGVVVRLIIAGVPAMESFYGVEHRLMPLVSGRASPVPLCCLRSACQALRMLELSQRHLGEENIAVYGGYANKLIKLQNDLLQTLDRRRKGNSQSIVVKHVHIHSGAQGVVGIVNHGESQKRGGDQK